MSFPTAPKSLNLSPDCVHVQNVDEEIFLLCTRQAAASISASTSTKHTALGFFDSNDLDVTLLIEEGLPPSDSATSKSARKGTGKRARLPRTSVVSVEVQQDRNALRNRAGDTGSVVWRISLALASHILYSDSFPSDEHPPLFKDWANMTVLELGSGTGVLGLLLSKTVSCWRWSDQESSLPLIAKNLRRNKVKAEAEEIDWLEDEQDYMQGRTVAQKEWPDVMIASDCIYNTYLSLPLARSISFRAGPETIVLVASEIRATEPLEAFLGGMLEEGWTIVRWIAASEDELSGKDFVVWLCWR